eukprot:scaffold13315_cov115-Isochrysis_galbana.AAC.9
MACARGRTARGFGLRFVVSPTCTTKWPDTLNTHSPRATPINCTATAISQIYSNRFLSSKDYQLHPALQAYCPPGNCYTTHLQRSTWPCMLACSRVNPCSHEHLLRVPVVHWAEGYGVRDYLDTVIVNVGWERLGVSMAPILHSVRVPVPPSVIPTTTCVCVCICRIRGPRFSSPFFLKIGRTARTYNRVSTHEYADTRTWLDYAVVPTTRATILRHAFVDREIAHSLRKDVALVRIADCRFGAGRAHGAAPCGAVASSDDECCRWHVSKHRLGHRTTASWRQLWLCSALPAFVSV